jgi:hypothetical protein
MSLGARGEVRLGAVSVGVSSGASKQRFTDVTSLATWTFVPAETTPPRRARTEPRSPSSAVCAREKKRKCRRPVCRRARATGWRTDRSGETWGRIRRSAVRAHPRPAPPRAGSAARPSPGTNIQPRRPNLSLLVLREDDERRSTRPARDSSSPGKPGDFSPASARSVFATPATSTSQPHEHDAR